MPIITIQIDSKLQKSFAKCVKENNRSASSLIHEPMHNFLEKNKPAKAKIDENGVFLSEEELKICKTAKKEIEAGEFVYLEDL